MRVDPGLVVQMPGYQFASLEEDPAMLIAVIDDLPAWVGDRFQISAAAVEVVPQPEDPITIERIELDLTDHSGQALDEVALPLYAPDPFDFSDAHVLRIVGHETANPGHGFEIICQVEDIDAYVTAVPNDLAPLPRLDGPRMANRPNPFNSRTEISFALARGGRVDLAVYNLQGRRLRTLVEGERPAGMHAVTWDGTDRSGHSVASGIYLAVLRTPEGKAVRRLCLVK